MNTRVKVIIIIGGIVVLGLLFTLPFSGQRQAPRVPPSTVSKIPETPKLGVLPRVQSQIPDVPKTVSLNDLTTKSLPASLPSFKIYKNPAVPLSESQIQAIGGSLEFSAVSENRRSDDGSVNYIFEDSRGRVLSVTNTPPSIDYSELPKEGTTGKPPTIDEALILSSNLINKMGPSLPDDWEIKVADSVYLKGGESAAGVVSKVGEASLTRVSLGYTYKGYKVLNDKGREIFFNFVFGPGGVVVSAKAELLVNNSNLNVVSSADVKAKNLEEVNKSFYNGEAKAVSLGLSGVVSDETIINPPTSVDANNLESVLVLSGEDLIPYYLVTTQGTLPSGRPGTVKFLVPASKSL